MKRALLLLLLSGCATAPKTEVVVFVSRWRG